MRQLLVAVVMAVLFCGEAGAQAPGTVAELQERWLELLREADGDISAKTFEEVLGLELLVTTYGAEGSVRRSVEITRLDGSSLRVDVHTLPARQSMTASLEWTPGYFTVFSGRSCLDPARLTDDLAAIGWTARPDDVERPTSPFAAIFQKNGNLAAYGNAREGRAARCRLFYQSHFFDSGRLDKSRRAQTKAPEG